ncbi:MAG TPA: TRAP transporter substrate-binding protein [Alphaproteobacteria bacterium]|nr:TRAP transporter substrate-binding protein [Alphaproteobacteria bacterium]
MLFLKRIAIPATSAALTLALVATPVTVRAETLRMANWLPPVHHISLSLSAWVAQVNKATGGSLKINLLKAPLAKPPGQYDLAKNGIADIAWGVPAYTPGRFPVMQAIELPFISPNAETGSAALWSWYAKHKMAAREYGDVKLLAVIVAGPGVLHTKTPVTVLEDLKGMKLRVGGGGVPLAGKLGAVPVAMPGSKAHEALLRGIVSGTFFPYSEVKGFRLAKLVKHHLEFSDGLYTSAFFVIMNKKRWNGLSAKNKAVLDKLGGLSASRLFGKRWDTADIAGKALAIKAGNKIRKISPAELARWRGKVQPLYDEWVAKADKAGLDGKALLADLQLIMKQQAKMRANR